MSTLYLPAVFSGPTPPPKSTDGEIRYLWMQELYRLMRDDPNQKRKQIIQDSKLQTTALLRVMKMAHEGWASHVDQLGHGPDYYVRQAGYVLPPFYYVPAEGDSSNHIESLFAVGADSTALGVWNGFLGHESHRAHLLGDGMFATQSHVGIGVYYLATSQEKLYVSVISAPPEGT